MQDARGRALTVVSAILAWEDEEEREHHLFVTAIASGIAILVYLVDYDTRCIGALALHAALFSILIRSTQSAAARRRRCSIGLVDRVTAGRCYLLSERPAYAYTPFLTIPSLCALATVRRRGRHSRLVRAAHGREKESED